MEKIKKILAPTDISELSLVGLRYALEMASSQGTEVIVYHVVGNDEVTAYSYAFRSQFSSSRGFQPAKQLVEERSGMLTRFLRENFADILPQVKIREGVELGVPAKRIVEKAKEEKVDMIVMSTHGRTGLLRMLIGSVTEKVVRQATCPVLSVRPTKEAKPAGAAAG